MDIKEELCNWYILNHRKLSFRESKDPYSIWVSEIMAQQTRIDTMLPYFDKWMNEFPDIESLANAPIERVLKLWEGLGYYNRARKLHEGAKYVIENYNGILPKSATELEKISGIGPYTAGAISSIAYNLESPAVDGNVLRVVSRLLMLDDDISKNKTKEKVTDIVRNWMKNSNPSDFTQGLMELGALICMPQITLCNECPLNKKCLAFLNQQEKNFPIKSKVKKQIELDLYTLLITKDNQIVLSLDDSDGLMKGFYRLPQKKEIDLNQFSYLGKSKHVFSHRIWLMQIYKAKENSYILNNKEIWFPIDQLDQIAIVSAHRKLLDQFLHDE